MRTLAPERCTACGGSVITERDEDGLMRKCMSCGREYGVVESTSTSTDWKAVEQVLERLGKALGVLDVEPKH
jgi:DNA-directed RNA polymerase subunit M/transcription elongation factor TFIIS